MTHFPKNKKRQLATKVDKTLQHKTPEFPDNPDLDEDLSNEFTMLDEERACPEPR